MKAIQARFTAHRATFSRQPHARQPSAPVDHKSICDARYTTAIQDEPLRRRQLLLQARQDEAAFWRGEIVPLPDDNLDDEYSDLRPDRWRDHISGDVAVTLETALRYAIRWQQAKRLHELHARHAIGDCEEFLPLARQIDPQARGVTLDRFALALMTAEIEALQDSSAADNARQLRRGDPQVQTPTPTAASPAPQLADAKVNPLLSVAKAEWLKEKTSGDLSIEYLASCEAAVALLIGITGDKPIAAYGKAEAREFKTVVASLPPNRKKLKATRNLSVLDAAKEAARLGMKMMDAKTVNKRISSLFNLFTWLADNYECVTTNPFDGINIATKSDPREEKDAFSLDELKAIFTAPMFTGCVSKRDWKTPGNFSLRDKAIYWLPILALYTGARANELATSIPITRWHDVTRLSQAIAALARSQSDVAPDLSRRLAGLHHDRERAW